MGNRKLILGAGAGLAGCLLLAGLVPAAAQSVGGGGIETVVVTAEKRADTLQNIPMSITAFTSDSIERQGITDFRDYAVHVPNLAFAYTDNVTGGQSPALRGIFGGGTTGMYLDDSPLPESLDPDVADIDRIEVLRGPQGTLYGARSMGGTIRLITKQPNADQLEGTLHGTVSDSEHGSINAGVDGAINVPLIKGELGVRANGFYHTESGIFDRVAAPGAPVNYGVHKGVDGDWNAGGQIAARWSLLDNKLVITPRVTFEQVKTSGLHLADYRAGNFTQVRLFDQSEAGGGSWHLYTLTAQYSASFGDFVLATTKFDRSFHASEDFSEMAELLIAPIPVAAVMRAKSGNDNFAQEARFTSNFNGPFQITFGAFYQNSDNTTVFPPTPVVPYFTNVFSQNLDTRVTETAVFGQATYDVTDKLRLTAGARWFDNKVKFVGSQDGALVFPQTFAGTQKENGINPKFAVEYKVTDDAKVYATAAKGFRIGGVNSYSSLLCAGDLAALGLTPAQVQSYNSDRLWEYEAGAKTSWFNHRLIANAAVFDIEWSGVQQNVALPTCGFALTLNAGKARSRGFELETTAALTDSLTVNLGTGYTDAVITNGGIVTSIAPGTRVQQVPLWTATAGADYDFDIASLPSYLHLDYAFVGKSYSANNSTATPRLRPAYGLTNMRVGSHIGNWEVDLFADNVFDVAANLADIPPLAIEYPGRPRIVTNRPRTVGIQGRLKF